MFVSTSQNQPILSKGLDRYQDAWQQVARELSRHYGDDLYKSWFSKLNFLEFSINTIILATPTNFIRDWIKSKYAPTILHFWQHYDANIKSIEIITKELPAHKQLVIDQP